MPKNHYRTSVNLGMIVLVYLGPMLSWHIYKNVNNTILLPYLLILTLGKDNVLDPDWQTMQRSTLFEWNFIQSSSLFHHSFGIEVRPRLYIVVALLYPHEK